MVRDDKLVSAAIKAKQPVERVVWIWGAILESAAEIDDNGRFNLDTAEVAYFLRADETDVVRVVAALAALERVSDDRVVEWGDRQFTSDRSADRQARYRERKRGASAVSDEAIPSGDGEVTSPSRHGDAPETETELEAETEREIPPPVLEAARPQDGARDLFLEFMEAYPDNPQSAETAARTAFSKLKPEEQEQAVKAADRQARWVAQEAEERGRTVDAQCRYSKTAANWLDSGKWREPIRLKPEFVSTLPADAQVVHRSQEELFRECEAVSGETVKSYMTKKSWPAPVVAKAVANIKARASPQAVSQMTTALH